MHLHGPRVALMSQARKARSMVHFLFQENSLTEMLTAPVVRSCSAWHSGWNVATLMRWTLSQEASYLTFMQGMVTFKLYSVFFLFSASHWERLPYFGREGSMHLMYGVLCLAVFHQQSQRSRKGSGWLLRHMPKF